MYTLSAALYNRYLHNRYTHSFPTRRSSDLILDVKENIKNKINGIKGIHPYSPIILINVLWAPTPISSVKKSLPLPNNPACCIDSLHTAPRLSSTSPLLAFTSNLYKMFIYK